MIEKINTPKRNTVNAKFLDIDQFGEGFHFKLPAGQDTYKTGIGAIITIIVALTLLSYGSLQLQRLVVFGETVVAASVKDSHFTADITFPFPDAEENQDFELAYGITAYDNVQEPFDDPRYGQLKAKYVTWGLVAG